MPSRDPHETGHAVLVRHITDDERRHRLASRHGLAPAARFPDVETATRAMTVLHATEPATVHLALFARVAGTTPRDVDGALYDRRTLVKQLAMRRTLFVFPRDLLPAAWGSASARVASQQFGTISRDVAKHDIARNGEQWVEDACAAVLDRLADGSELNATQLRTELPALAGHIQYKPEKKYGGTQHLAPRILTLLGARGLITRGTNAAHWKVNKPMWAATESWLGEPPHAWTSAAGYAELVRRWLWTFGPGTEEDLVWWLGATKASVRQALADTGAVRVTLDHDRPGWLAPGDDEVTEPPAPWGALLPVLDPTTMGWRDRDFHLDPAHVPYLFDTNGNGGTTAWWNGRIVGCWVQDPDAAVRVLLREDIGAEGVATLESEAERLTAWLDGVVINSVYASAQMKAERLP